MRNGFTLIQISILLMVASLVLVTVLPSQTAPLKNSSDTVTNLYTLLLELRKFQAAYGYLPCPADASQPLTAANYGVAAANAGASGNCYGSTPAANFSDSTNHVAIGMVPVKTLGISKAYALDAFGRDVTYAVDTNATVCWPSTSLTGQIAVADNGTTNNTVAALVSHGPDGHGAWLPLAGSTGTAQRLNAGSTDTDQLVNAHLTTGTFPTSTASSLVTDAASASVTFVNKLPTTTFDDLVVYKSPLWTLNNEPLVIQNSVPTVTPPANGTYTSGQTISFTLTYPSAVTVNTSGGTPYLALSAITGSIGTSNLAKATYQSGSGTTALVFSYTVAGSDSAPTGITLTSPVNLNGGTISGCPQSFTVPNLSGVLIGGQSIYIADWASKTIRMINAAGIISTVVDIGGTTCGPSTAACGDGGAATSATINSPYDVAVDSAGNLYIADSGDNRIRKVTASTGIITTIAGTGTQGYSGDGGSATSAYLYNERGVAVDGSGNIYIADYGNYRVRKVTASTGIITTVAGTGTSGYSGDGGLATSAEIGAVYKVAVDGSGNLYLADYGNFRVREVTASTGIITTVAGNGTQCSGTAVCGDGGPATSANIHLPYGLTFDSSGNLYIADYADSRIRKVTTSTGIITTVAGTGTSGYSGDGGLATSAELHFPYDVAVDNSGNLYIADDYNFRIRKVTASTGIITTIAGNGTQGYSGDGGSATSAELYYPSGVAVGNR